MTAPGKDAQDALAALERLLLKHKVITEAQAVAAARLVTGDPAFVFPPPRAPPAPPAATPEAPPPEPAPEAAPADNASPPGSEAP